MPQAGGVLCKMLMMWKGVKISCGLQFTIFGGYVVIITSNWIFFNLDLDINTEHCKMKIKMKIYFLSCICLCLFALWCNWMYYVLCIFFSQNRSEYEKRVRSQAAKFQLTWWKDTTWYTSLQTCGFTITSRRIYCILLLIRQFQWNRSCKKNLSLLQYGCCCDNDKHFLEIMSVFLGRLLVFVVYSVINLYILMHSQTVERQT